jgi:hypothetical protein
LKIFVYLANQFPSIAMQVRRFSQLGPPQTYTQTPTSPEQPPFYSSYILSPQEIKWWAFFPLSFDKGLELPEGSQALGSSNLRDSLLIVGLKISHHQLLIITDVVFLNKKYQ